MKSKIEINISVIDDGPVVMRCQGQNASKGKALDALEDAYLSTVAQLMRKDLSKAEQEEAAKEFGEMMQDRLLAMVRGKSKRYMVSSEKEMSFMTELMRRLRKVNLRRDEINEEMLEVMAQPRKSGREQAAAGQAWLVSLLPEGAETEFRVPLGKGAARKQKELQIRMAVDNAATLEWRVYAAACAEVLGFGAKRLNDLHKAVLENFRQLSAWAIEDGVDVALERFCRCARDAYKTDVQVEDIPDAQALHQQQRQTRQALDGLAERAWMVEASRKRVGCLPLAPAEVEKRIQTVLQAPAMPESWERRRAR